MALLPVLLDLDKGSLNTADLITSDLIKYFCNNMTFLFKPALRLNCANFSTGGI